MRVISSSIHPRHSNVYLYLGIINFSLKLRHLDILQRHLLGRSHLIRGRRSPMRCSAQFRFHSANIATTAESNGQTDDRNGNTADENVAHCVRRDLHRASRWRLGLLVRRRVVLVEFGDLCLIVAGRQLGVSDVLRRRVLRVWSFGWLRFGWGFWRCRRRCFYI